jgi:hypothetical protein
MPDVITGVMAGASVYSAFKGGQAADASGESQDMATQLEIERDEYNKEIIEESNVFSREDRSDVIARRERERGIYDPLQENLVDQAMQGPDYKGAVGRSDADVSEAYGVERGKQRRREQRYGVNPASGRTRESEVRGGNAEALAKVGGRNRARLNEDDRDWARKLAALGTGNMVNATPGSNLTQLGPSGAAGAYAGQAQTQGANAAAGYSLAGSLASDAVNRYDNYQQPAFTPQQTGVPMPRGVSPSDAAGTPF